MVKFKKGTKVEVFSDKEVATGAWRCAEILSGNGHTYYVKFGWFPMSSEMEEVVERVPRKAIRPCPPPVDGMGDWVEGDLVEVFDVMSWKAAVVVEVVDENNFLVRLLGVLKRLHVLKSHLRVRQQWQGDSWIVIGKQGLENYGMLKGSESGRRIKLHIRDDFQPMEANANIQHRSLVSTITSKRGSPLSYDLGAYPSHKRRAVEKDGSHQPICVHASPSFEKVVDTFVYPNKTLGKNYVHSSFNNGPAEFSGMVTGSSSDSSLVESASSADTMSCASSVGSCSISSRVASIFGFKTEHNDDLEDCCSDAESSNAHDYVENQCSYSSDEDVGLRVHRLKFQTYYSVVGQLYTSGPLSWEDQERLTNLRSELDISDDEHLMVLRNLSANSRILVS